jgi:hypothetical protein
MFIVGQGEGQGSSSIQYLRGLSGRCGYWISAGIDQRQMMFWRTLSCVLVSLSAVLPAATTTHLHANDNIIMDQQFLVMHQVARFVGG